ncbi:hypothetical protein GN244_ATG13529 [Phytophthora infestans]|uniref:Uncharacterized protein n=1 Tax=Phytophthora infestans TaxID=4787 RepID=A0A833SP49_PHYIN|nr:hypothetical protein GN244_ATG13529 [Phytophthora infestans]
MWKVGCIAHNAKLPPHANAAADSINVFCKVCRKLLLSSEEERLRAEGRRANPICKRKIVAHLRTHESVTPMSTVTVTAAAAPSSEAKERRYDAFLDAEETRKKTKRGSVLFAVSVPIAKADSVTTLRLVSKTAVPDRVHNLGQKDSINVFCKVCRKLLLSSEEERLRAEGRRANPICKRKIVAHLRTHESVTPMSTVTVTAAAAPSSEAKERRYDAFLDAEETRKKMKRGSVLFAVSVPIANADSVTTLRLVSKTAVPDRVHNLGQKDSINVFCKVCRKLLLSSEEERLRAEGRRANPICKRKIVAHLRTHESVTPMSTVTVTAAAAPSSEAKERRYDAFLDAEETRKKTKRASVLFAVSVPIAKADSVTSKKRKRKHKMKNKKNAQV